MSGSSAYSVAGKLAAAVFSAPGDCALLAAPPPADRLHHQPGTRPADWLVGWLVGWFVRLLVGWLAGWLVSSLAGWLVSLLAGWLVG